MPWTAAQVGPRIQPCRGHVSESLTQIIAWALIFDSTPELRLLTKLQIWGLKKLSINRPVSHYFPVRRLLVRIVRRHSGDRRLEAPLFRISYCSRCESLP